MAEPKVRFKKLDGSAYPSWVKYSVADIFDKVKDKNKNLENKNVITNSAEFGLVNQREFFDKDIAVEGKTNNYTIIKNGDFVYNPRKSTYAPMGPFNCYELQEDGIVSPLYTCLRPKGVLNSRFLLWYFKTDKWHNYVNENGAQNGARHDRVGMTDLIMMGIPVTAPTSEEQKKISDFLDEVDYLIASSEKEIEKLQEFKKGCLQKMFPRDGADVPEVRFPGFNDAWEQRKLSEVCKRITDGSHFSPAEVEDGYPMPSVKDMTENGFNYTSCKRISKDDYDVLVNQGCKPEIGDVLVAKDGSILKYAFVIKENQEVVILSSIAILKPDCQYIDGCYLAQYFKIDSFKKRVIDENTTGTGVPRIVLANFKNFEICFPNIEEQQRIGQFLDELDNLITLHQRECEKYRELKAGLLQKMFV